MSHTATATIEINAPAEKVWGALVNPDLVKQYMFGTTMKADLRIGGAITYSGEWEGKTYEDKGKILELEPHKILKSTYFSSMSGQEDKPENYQVVTYQLEETGGKTTLTVTQDNNHDEQQAKHSSENWSSVLKQIKQLVEKS